MKKLFSILTLILFCTGTLALYAAPAHAIADRCPRHDVKTKLKTKKYKTRFQRASLETINDYLNHHSVLAFVDNPIDINLEYKFDLLDIKDGKKCLMLKKVQANYISAPRRVMPKDFSSKSCEYKIILKHENRHLRVHYEYYDQSVKDYASFLGRIAKRVPVSVPLENEEEVEEMQEHITKYFSDEFGRRITKSINEMRAMQQKIDSPQEYIFTGKKIERCRQREAREKQPNKKTFHDPNEK